MFGNFLLADEINRAPAKVQSALLEVMQEQQVTIGGQTFPVPAPFLVMATQNPIEAEGTYPLPEAQVDRFLMKILVDYPSLGEEAAVVGRSLVEPADVRECLALEKIERYAAVARSVFVDREVIGYAVALADATRRPAEYGLPELERLIEYGASPRGPIGLVQAARVLALLRGRGHVSIADVRDLAADVLRHRIVLSYDALSENVTAGRPDRARPRRRPRAGGRPPEPAERRVTQTAADWCPPRGRARARSRSSVVEALDLVVARRTAGVLPGDRRAAGVGAGTELAQLRPYEPGDDVRHIDPAATARTGEPHVRVHVPERTLTTWIVLDVSPSMAFGTANRLKSDVAEGVALVVARLAVRRAGRVALMTFGAGKRHLRAAARVEAGDDRDPRGAERRDRDGRRT